MLARHLLGLAALAGLATTAFAQYPGIDTPAWGPPKTRAASLATPTPDGSLPYATGVYQAAVTQPAPLPGTVVGGPPSAPPTTLPNTTTTPPTPAKPAPLSVTAPTAPTLSGPTYPSCPTCTPACDTCCTPPCGPPGRVWMSAEWLFWAASGQHIPSLVTTSPVGTDRSLAGVIPSPNTAVLYGTDARGNTDFRNGLRINGGIWCNDAQTIGIEGNFFFLGGSNNQFAAGSNGSEIIARPFYNVLTNTPDSELVSFPGVLGGTVTVDNRSSVIGGGINAVHNLCCTPCGRLDLLYGYQYFNVTDTLSIREDLTALPGQTQVAPGTTYQILDKFRTTNNFNGGLIGLSAERRYGMWFVGGRASIAFGADSESVEINGVTRITSPTGVSMAYTGGLLAQPSNIGHYEYTAFAVLPQIGLRAGVQVSQYVRVFAGYNFLYLSNVARAGDQVDLRVNPSQLPPRTTVTGPAFPAFNLHTTDYSLQGISLGMEVRF